MVDVGGETGEVNVTRWRARVPAFPRPEYWMSCFPVRDPGACRGGSGARTAGILAAKLHRRS